MIDISILRDEPGRVRQAILDKGYKETELVDQILALDTAMARGIDPASKNSNGRANSIAKDIGVSCFKRGPRKMKLKQKKAESL